LSDGRRGFFHSIARALAADYIFGGHAYQITQHRHRPEAEAAYHKRKPATLAIDPPRIITVKSAKQLKREREIRFAKAAAEGEASPEIKAFIDRVLRPPSEPFVWHLTRETPVDE
jgi:hypothetical protein